MTIARSVARAVASPVARAVAGGIGTSGGVQNLLAWSEFGGAASSVPGPAAAPTGCFLFGNTGSQTLLGPVGNGQGIEMECVSQRQYWESPAVSVSSGVFVVFTFYIDAIDGSISKNNITRFSSLPAGTLLDDTAASTISAPGRYWQQFQTSASGEIKVRFGVGVAASITRTVSFSRPMLNVFTSQVATIGDVPDYVPGS